MLLENTPHSGLYRKTITTLVFVASLTACSSLKGPAYQAATQDDKVFNTPLRAAKKEATNNGATLIEQKAAAETHFEVLPTPTLSVEQAAEQATETVLPVLEDKTISRLSFNNMPVGAFINEVFGNQLGLNYVVEPSVKNTADLVTMRLASTVKQKDLYELATETLKSYGVTTSIKNNVLLFDFSENASNGDIPFLVSGRTLPEVPSNSRPIFFVYPLQSVNTPQVRGWLSQMFPRKELDIKEDINRNALIFNGAPRIINQALAATKLLDQPAMQGMYSRIIRPSLSSVSELAENLEQVLKSEGYSVRQADSGSAAIRLLPLESVGQLIVFSQSSEVLNHIIDWAKTLETERHSTVEQGLFSYQVRGTQATHIVDILNSLGVADYQSTANDGSSSASTSNSPSATPRTNTRSVNPNAKGRYAVDEQLNTILYSGSGKDWLQVLPVIKKLDKPAPSVMVEVILAEVQLNDNEETGLEWLAKSTLGKYDLAFASSGAGLVTTLLNNTLGTTVDTAGQTRAILNAFYENKKANIRSRPRIMVKSGGEASIDVGNEIPVITQSSQSTSDSNAPVIETVSYRKTGVILKIKPTVHASGFVDIEIDQELSESTGGGLTPTILNRKLTTTVTLRDGGSVLLGGLISSSTSKGQTGVPILGRLPVIGKLFNTDTDSQDRTELMIMIIPYVLNSPDEAEKLTDELQQTRIENLSADIVPQEN
ncbi:secretin N-terminal domain-containing protein [Paraglaciecola aestuariivivens]